MTVVTLDIIRKCTRCGTEFHPRKDPKRRPNLFYYYCKECLRKQSNEDYHKAADKKNAWRTVPKINIRNAPVVVVGFGAGLTDADREELRCFLGSRFHGGDFTETCRMGYFDVLLVDIAGTRYTVIARELVQC